MQRHLAVLGWALLAGPAIPISAQTFEGTIEYRQISLEGSAVRELLGGDPWSDDPVDPEAVFAITAQRALELAADGTAEVEEATYLLKGSQARFESDEGYVIMNLASGIIRMVHPAERLYMEMSLAQIQGMRQGAPVMTADAPTPGPARRIGLAETIHGARAIAYQVRAGPEVTRAWMTDEQRQLMGSMRAILDFMGQMDEDSDVDVVESLVEHGFPMRMVTVNVETGDLQIEEFLAIRAGAVPDDRFAIPAGFTKQTIPGM